MNDKDQAAIDHVASVSKTHNARMILEWLMDGCVYDDYTDDDGDITAIRLEKRIKPKPAKPAYRVYADQDGDLFVAERNSEGGICQTHTERIEWISEWVEYDPPNKWPTPLIERIAAIDLDAAQWIVEHWDDLLEDKYTYKNNYSRDCDTLTHMFDWETPPQGTDYWESISAKLGE